uniref:Uncharacterized protein n=1 Tax=Anguilla anguilla TaxID=7936 RepID=A0A0E9T2D8_ANGAN
MNKYAFHTVQTK